MRTSKRVAHTLCSIGLVTDSKKPSNPFAALASLKESLPPGEAKAAKTESKSTVDKRFAAKIVVAKSKKGRGGKTVTCVRGIDASAAQLEQLAKELRQALGCGSSVEENEIIVQGEQTERVAKWLEAQGAKRVVIGT
jgi:translation initiation factor 1